MVMADEANSMRHHAFIDPIKIIRKHKTTGEKKTARCNERSCQIDNVISLMRESAIMINLLLRIR
jgi:hypothetical protein